MKTYLAKTGEIKRETLLFDASEAPVGRLAVRIANALRGKDRPTYTGHRSGYVEETVQQIRESQPTRLIKMAVWGMMPHGRLGRAQFAKLKIYAGAEHPHAAQNPVKVTME